MLLADAFPNVLPATEETLGDVCLKFFGMLDPPALTRTEMSSS